MPEVEFLQIYGAMTIHGIPKPVWRAFQLLHEHAGDRRLPTIVHQPIIPNTTTVPYISAFATMNATGGAESLRVFLSFWGNPDSATNATLLAANRTVTVTVRHAAATARQLLTGVNVHIVDAVHGNPFSKWQALGKIPFYVAIIIQPTIAPR